MKRYRSLAQICQSLAIFNFPFRDPSRPRARGIRTNTTRDLVEPRCVPPTTRPEHATLFPPTNGFYSFGVSRVFRRGQNLARPAVRNRDLRRPRVQRGGGGGRRRRPKLSRSGCYACLTPTNTNPGNPICLPLLLRALLNIRLWKKPLCILSKRFKA